MSTQTKDTIEWLNPTAKKLPEIKVGATIRVHQKIKEGAKERIQIFEGLVIKKAGVSPDLVITVRRVSGGIGIEKIIPLMSTNVDKIDIVKEANVRRAKLYYMRNRSGKSARLKETYLTDAQRKKILKDQGAPEAEAAAAVAAVDEPVAPVEEAPAVEEVVSASVAEVEKTPEVPAEEIATEAAPEVAEEKEEEPKVEA